MRTKDQMTPTERSLMEKIIGPGKPDGTCLTVFEVRAVDMPFLEGLIRMGDATIDTVDGKAYVMPKATPSEIDAAGWLNLRQWTRENAGPGELERTGYLESARTTESFATSRSAAGLSQEQAELARDSHEKTQGVITDEIDLEQEGKRS